MTSQLAALVEELRDFGCSDGYCALRGPAKGMHTNGGCHCLDRPHIKVRWLLKQILTHLRSEATPNAPAVSVAEHQEGSR